MNIRFFQRIILIYLIFSLNSIAQVSFNPGVIGGLSIYNETFKTSYLTMTGENKIGFIAGGVFDLGINKYLSIEPELIFSTRGTILHTGMGNSITATFSHSYLSIPFLIKGKVPFNSIIPYAIAGVNPGVLLTADEKREEASLPTTNEKDTTLTAFDFGFNFGAGVELKVGDLIPFIDFIQYVGLLNIAKDKYGVQSQKSKGFEIQAGIKFILKR